MAGSLGTVYLVGAGPGDPQLFTLRGQRVLSAADVVVYDQLANPRLLELAPVGCERVFVGKSSGRCTISQVDIAGLLIDRARAGLTVVRLKGGDPLVFGRGGEEAIALQAAGIPFEIVPGVTAGLGVLAHAGIPVTHRGESSAVAFITGHNDPDSGDDESGLDWPALARFPGTLVVYMGIRHLDAICAKLIRSGKPGSTPSAVIESGTLGGQRTHVGTLETIAGLAAAAGARPPALLVIGSVVSLRTEIAWSEKRPLFGQRIVITRPIDEARRVAIEIEELGAEALLAPTVVLRPIADHGPLDSAIDHIADYDWVVFTSAAGVRFFWDRLEARGRDARALGSVRLATIGPATAGALAQYHLRADLVSESYRSESLAETLAASAAGGRILLAQADRGRGVLRERLERVATVDQVAVYHNEDADELPDPVVARLNAGTVDWITLTSPAIANRLLDLLPVEARTRIGAEIKLATISPITTEAVVKRGYTVAVEAITHDWPGLVRAMIEWVARQRDAIPSRQWD
jgi:uroporphyrinogen III methyltransferase/synthase